MSHGKKLCTVGGSAGQSKNFEREFEVLYKQQHMARVMFGMSRRSVWFDSDAIRT